MSGCSSKRGTRASGVHAEADPSRYARGLASRVAGPFEHSPGRLQVFAVVLQDFGEYRFAPVRTVGLRGLDVPGHRPCAAGLRQPSAEAHVSLDDLEAVARSREHY